MMTFWAFLCSTMLTAATIVVHTLRTEDTSVGRPLNPDDFDRAMAAREDGYNTSETNQIQFVDLPQGDIQRIMLEDRPKQVSTRNGIRALRYRWPKGNIPYILDHRYDKKGRDQIARAFQSYHRKTCIKFIPRTNERDYIKIKKGKHCNSHVGRLGRGEQIVNIEGTWCLYGFGYIEHELMHAIGFDHHQRRSDRDKYIKINWGNIKEDCKSSPEFKKLNTRDWKNFVGYDYCSILHYDYKFCGKDPNVLTMIPRRPNPETIIKNCKNKKPGGPGGPFGPFAYSDLLSINRMYNCNGKRQTIPNCIGDNKLENKDGKCKIWASNGKCAEYPEYMQVFCAKACNQRCKEEDSRGQTS